MTILRRVRFSMADVAMLVVAASAASALFAKLYRLMAEVDPPTSRYDAPTLLVLAIVLTAVALGAYKAHPAALVMLQVTIACLGALSLIWLVEAERARVLLYWLQAAFGLTVAGPMLARRFVKSAMPRGPRRSWWKKTLEAVVFSFLNMLLVAVGLWIEIIVADMF